MNSLKTIPGGARLLKENAHSLLYLWKSPSYLHPVVIKVLNNENPKSIHLIQLYNEYEVTRSLNLPFARKALEKIRIGNREGLLLEYRQGTTLKEHIAAKVDFGIHEFLKLAIEITGQLVEIHQRGYYHKDINSNNILVDNHHQVTFIDFGLATPFDAQGYENISEGIEGTLSNLSPEQTGRMNRKVDYRTDFYSLGITLFEMATGQLPFNFSDAMEMVHAHLAVEPPAANEFDDKIPSMVSRIIKKLLSKNAEMRYQSASGLKADLEKCLTLLQVTGHISEFKIAEQDISGQFVLPQKLFGREKELHGLKESLDRAVSNSSQEIILLKGEAGAGKSVLAAQLQKELIAHHGFYISGKCDELQASFPYNSIIQAFKGFVDLLLSETEEEIEKWKTQLSKAMGDASQVLINVIPNLELILGTQPPLPEVGATEASYRFNFVFTNFIKAVVNTKHPLVIFLDDLQWVDSASLDLIQVIVADKEIGRLVLIGACRDDRESNNFLLTKAIEEIKEIKKIEEWHVGPLSKETISEILSETLSCTTAKAAPLAEIIFSKTLGNAFFVNQFLKSLHEQNYLKWEMQPGGLTGGWAWSENQILTLNITDNVVELLCQSIRKMELQSQQALMTAACIGNRFSIVFLAEVLGQSEEETLKLLQPSFKSGLIMPYGMPRASLATAGSNIQKEFNRLKFKHDRIQQAAYSLLDEKQLRETHLKIGKVIISNRGQSEEHIFEIVNHFKLADNRVEDEQQKIELAHYNFLAGRKAKRSVAFPQAMDYFTTAIEMVEDFKPWLNHYAFTLELYSEATETAYLTSNFILLTHLTAEVLKNARTLLDKVKVYETQIQYHKSKNQLLEAVHTALKVLRLLGIRLPIMPTKLNIVMGLLAVQLKMNKRKVARLHELPIMTDANMLAAMRILVSINSSAYFALPGLFPLLVFEQVQLSLKYGNCEYSPFAYASFGVVKTGVLGDIEGGYQIGKAAENLLNQFDSKGLQLRTTIVINGFLNHWKMRPHEFVLRLPALFQQAQEAGDIEYAALCAFNQTLYSFFLGHSLQRLESEAAHRDEVIASLNQSTPLYFNKIFLQSILNLKGKSSEPTLLIGTVYDENEQIPIHQKARDKTSLFACHLQKAYLCFTFGKPEEAVEQIAEAKKYLESAIASVAYPIFFFYESLILLRHLRAAKGKKSGHQKIIKANLKKLKKWAQHAPDHHRHRYLLVLAEWCAYQGNADCERYYDEACTAAKENEFIQDGALIQELIGKYYFHLKKESLSIFYFENSIRGYIHWGASEKVKQMMNEFGHLLNVRGYDENTIMPTLIQGSMITGAAGGLDLNTVVKASQAISGEIVLGKLLEKMMGIVVQSAGAQRGVLIDNDNGHLRILVHNKKTMITELLDNSTDLPNSVIQYVARTQKSLVFGNAFKDLQFGNDSYFIREQPKSILCYPVIRKEKLSCIIFLENNLAYDAFTSQRLALLDILAPQIAISIENALLYEKLEEKVKARTKEIQRKSEELEFQKSEIMDQRDRLEEAQQEIIVKNKKLSEVNTDLESIVNERTSELKIALDKLKDSNKELDTFIYRASHDLKGPIVRIQGLTMITQREMDESVRKMNIHRIELTAIEMGRLLSKLINIHEIFREELERSKVNFEQLFNDISKTLQPLIWENTEFIKINCPPLLHVYSDHYLLKIILENLVENGIVFRKSIADILIKVEVTVKDNFLVVVVEDNGVGINAEIIVSVFDMFFRGTEKSIGSGLGLYLAKKATEKLGGTIHIESEEMKFTRVTVRLPL